ncbi:MAG: SpoIID/LytB domain-containing protein [Planctomycetes bacterium]|nr:SpoIID/LytB domain-containing protein [Planctomycetota bacterium]
MSLDLLNRLVRAVVLVGLVVFFAYSLVLGLLEDDRRMGRLEKGGGQDPGVRVLLLNRVPPDPSRFYEKVDVTILEPVDVVTPNIPDDPQYRLTLRAGAILRVQADTNAGLMLGSKEWGKDYTWPVSAIRIQPQRTDPPAPVAPADINPARRDPTLFEAQDHEPVFTLATGRYRGSLDIMYHSAKDVAVINCLPMEAYIEGVVAVEMSPSYPLEALKAQAIASRSYAYAHQILARQAHQEFDLSDTADDQEYRGKGDANGVVRSAVFETRGVVMLVDKTNPFAPLFCASSGGYTESVDSILPGARDVFGRVPLGRVMTAHPDHFCKLGAEGLGYESSHWSYTTIIKPADLQRALAKVMEAQGKHIGWIRNLRVGKRDPRSNRVETVLIDHTVDREPIEMSANSFRMLVGPFQLRSTLWSADSPKRIESTEGKRITTYQITSQGFGHGVGMSQISAWEMANEKYLAEDILKTFYQDIQLTPKW